MIFKISDQGIFNLMSKNVGETIEEIHIANCKKITDESIEAILHSSNVLTCLMFHSCPKVTGNFKLKLMTYWFNASTASFNSEIV
jgi:hypothetical protein